MKEILVFYGSISFMMFAINGPLRPPFIAISGETFWGKWIGAALFIATVTVLAIVGNMLYKWLLKKVEAISFKRKAQITTS